MTDQADISGRRSLLRKWVLWCLGLFTAALLYPLSRFTAYTVKTKPRYISVNKALQTGDYYTERDFILFIAEDGPLAVSRRCTHLGCRVAYREELDFIECPCHQSRFTIRGLRISGPAEKNLSTFPVTVQEDSSGKVSGYVVTV